MGEQKNAIDKFYTLLLTEFRDMHGRGGGCPPSLLKLVIKMTANGGALYFMLFLLPGSTDNSTLHKTNASFKRVCGFRLQEIIKI